MMLFGCLLLVTARVQGTDAHSTPIRPGESEPATPPGAGRISAGAQSPNEAYLVALTEQPCP